MSVMLPLMYRSKLEPGLIELRTAAVDSRITFTRSSSRTYFDSAGVLQTAANDVWPLEYDPATGLVLGRSIWAAATNLLTYSEEFNNAAWNKTGVTVSTDAVVAPDGTTTADKLVENVSTGNHFAGRSFAIVSGTTYSISVFAKAAGRTRMQVFGRASSLNGRNATINLANATVVSSTWEHTRVQDVGNGWCKISVSTTANGNGPNPNDFFFYIDNGSTNNYTGDGTSGIYIWGAQLETGSIATPYIPTTSATVTRAADFATVSTLSSIGFNASEGTIVVRGRTPTGIAAGGDNRLCAFNDGAGNERIVLYRTTTAAFTAVTDGGVNTANVSTGALALNSSMAYAFGYKQDDFALSVNGSAAVTDVSGTLPTVDRLHIGRDGVSLTTAWNGYISHILYIPRRITNAELQKASTL